MSRGLDLLALQFFQPSQLVAVLVVAGEMRTDADEGLVGGGDEGLGLLVAAEVALAVAVAEGEALVGSGVGGG